jgi:hypothetical protein
MFDLSNDAAAHLHKSLESAKEPGQEGKCFRVVPKDGKYLTLKLATPAPSDSTYRHDGAIVLALPKALHPPLRNKSLDIDDTGRLKLRLN